VALGAFAVFRTKREPHETVFGKPPEGEVFSIDNFGEDTLNLDIDGDEPAPVSENIAQRNRSFMEQFDAAGAEVAASLGPEGGKLQ
jgi:hypothetical protein